MLMQAPAAGDTFTGPSGFAYTAASLALLEIGGGDVRVALQRNWSETPYPVPPAVANLPIPARTQIGVDAYTSDQGEVVNTGAAWVPVGTGTPSVPGAAFNGTTDDSAAFNAMIAGLTGAAEITIAYPTLWNSSVTFPANARVTFIGRGLIKRGASAVITIPYINAGPQQIFDNSAGGSGKFLGATRNVFIYDEWFGALSDGVTLCTTAMNASRALAHAAGDIEIRQLAGTYLLDGIVYGIGSSAQSATAPSCYGVGKKKTIWSYPGVATALKFVGGSGLPQACVYQGISFVGDASSIAVMFAGVCGYKLIRCMFDSNAIGIQWHNEASGTFTEYCPAESCEWRSNCLISVDYKVTAGNNSFNGSGIDNRGLINASATGPVVRIGSGANVYSAPFDAQVWSTSGSITIFQNSNATAPVPAGFAGKFTLETTTSVTTTLGASHAVYFSGPVQMNGLTILTGANVLAGTFLRVKTMEVHADSSYSITGAENGRQVALTVPSASMAGLSLSGPMNNLARIADVSVSATNYKSRQFVAGDYFGDGSTAAGGAILAQTANFNNPGGTLGYQAITAYTGSGDGSLNITVPTVAKVATGAFSGSETSATLTLSWQSPTGTYNWLFSNGNVRAVACTQGSAGPFSWTGGLGSAATTALTCQTWPVGSGTFSAYVNEIQQSNGIEGSGHIQI